MAGSPRTTDPADSRTPTPPRPPTRVAPVCRTARRSAGRSPRAVLPRPEPARWPAEAARAELVSGRPSRHRPRHRRGQPQTAASRCAGAQGRADYAPPRLRARLVEARTSGRPGAEKTQPLHAWRAPQAPELGRYCCRAARRALRRSGRGRRTSSKKRALKRLSILTRGTQRGGKDRADGDQARRKKRKLARSISECRIAALLLQRERTSS